MLSSLSFADDLYNIDHMLRHLKNANELILYASLSCGASFLVRLLPPFYWPILLLRSAIFVYCAIVLYRAENNRELAMIIGASLFIGMLGGYWDYIEVLIKYDLQLVVTTITSVLCASLIIGLIYIQVMNNGSTGKK